MTVDESSTFFSNKGRFFYVQIVKKLSKLSDLNPIYINMLISYVTATVCCIYLILKVI